MKKTKFKKFRELIVEAFKTLFKKEYNCNSLNHAKRELELAGMFDKDSMYGGMIGEAVMELMELFSKQGHSGLSASIVRQLFNLVSDFKPLSPITGEDSEWNECGTGGFQNNRCSSIFKEDKDGQAYYINAVIFRGQSGSCFTGGGSVKLSDGSGISSSQYIKKFPFNIPDSIYIDVIETEWEKDKNTGKLTKKDGGGWWTSTLKDESQLKMIDKHYDVSKGYDKRFEKIKKP